MDSRKVQQVGYSTLAVSLPKSWTEAMKVSAGDFVSFRREEDGSLRLYPGGKLPNRQDETFVIHADQCRDRGLIARLIIGAYIIGYDSIQVVSKRELTQEHLGEVRRAVQRLTGAGIVEETPSKITIRSFLDPTGLTVGEMLNRMGSIALSMQNLVIRALREKRLDLAGEAINMEQEVDRMYRLAVRQLLLGSMDWGVASKIGIESPLNIAGNRVICKALEKIGDYGESSAREAMKVIRSNWQVDAGSARLVTDFGRKVASIQERTVHVLMSGEISDANALIEDIERAESDEAQVMDQITSKIRRGDDQESRDTAANPGRVSAMMALGAIVWNSGHMARFCSTIAEILINRALQKSSSLCGVERSGSTSAGSPSSDPR